MLPTTSETLTKCPSLHLNSAAKYQTANLWSSLYQSKIRLAASHHPRLAALNGLSSAALSERAAS
jgi:hypothetical protein